jgi:DNA anti-recombination protein RmuC
MERSMNRIIIASFSFLVVLGSAQASLSSEENAISAQNEALQVSLVKFQSSQQSQLTALDAKVHAELQTIQEQLLSLAQLQSQITALNKQLQNQANLVISGVDAQVKQLQSSMTQQVTEIQNTLNHLAAAKASALNTKAAEAAAAAAKEAKAAKAAAAKKPGAKKSNAPAN